MALLDFINAYTRRIEDFLDCATPSANSHRLPFAILGSTVHIACPDDKHIYKVKAVLPSPGFRSSFKSAELLQISCVSPAGRALLFAAPAQEVCLEENGWALHGAIEKIDFDMIL